MSLEKKWLQDELNMKQEQEKKDQKLLEKPEQLDAGAKQLSAEASEAAKAGSQVSPESKKEIDGAKSRFDAAIAAIDPNLQGKDRLGAIEKEYQKFQGEIEKIVGTTEAGEAKQNKEFMEGAQQAEKDAHKNSSDFMQKIIDSIKKGDEQKAHEKLLANKDAAKKANELKEQEASKKRSEAAGEVTEKWPA